MKSWKKFIPPALVSFVAAACGYLKKFHEFDFALHLPNNDTLREVLSLFMTPWGVIVLLLTVVTLAAVVIRLARKLARQKVVPSQPSPPVQVLPVQATVADRPKAKSKILVRQEKIEFTRTQIEKEIESEEEIEEPLKV